MKPLKITAHLYGHVLLESIALDALLAAVVARKTGVPPICVAGKVEIEIPVQKEHQGRFHLCSFGQFRKEPGSHDTRYTNRRFPAEMAARYGTEKQRSINVSAGLTKTYRIPRQISHLNDDKIDFFALGDLKEIEELLSWVKFVGKQTSVGNGKIKSWTVQECEGWEGFPVLKEGRPLRPLPVDYNGLGHHELAYRVLTYPYWERNREELCAVATDE